MITPQDIRNILYRDCKAFGIDEVYERIVVYVKRQQPGTYWIKNFNEVNIQVPRIQNRANCIRMQELEHKALELLDGITGEYEGCSYLYQIDQVGTEADTALKCHYVNVRLLFQVLNVK